LRIWLFETCCSLLPVNSGGYPMKKSSRISIVLAFLFVSAAAASVFALKDEGGPGDNLNGWGKLGKAVSGSESFYDFSFYYKDERGRKKPAKAFVEISPAATVYYDRVMRIQDLKKGSKVRLFARAVEQEVRGGPPGGGGGQQGRSGTDRQIQNAQVVILGEAVEVNESYEHPKDKQLKWIDATVESSNSGLAVSYQGNTYRVTIDRKAPIINRTKVEHKYLKKARYVHVVGTSSQTRPKTKSRSDASKSSFKSKRVIILDARAAKAFPLLFD